MHAHDHIDALWDFLTSGRTKGLAEQLRADPLNETLAVLDVREAGPSFVGPPARYFTVKVESQGRVRCMHLQALDEWNATSTAMESDPRAATARPVREISRAEFERLTKRPS